MEEEKQILHEKARLDDREIWYDTEDPDFIEISRKSRVEPHWLSYQKVLKGSYGTKPVKPINSYAENIGYEPSLVGIEGNTVKLRFHLYADIYLIKRPEDEKPYNVDRTWIRQYYRTAYAMEDRDDCFEDTYKFYVPWFIDQSLEVSYSQPDTESPFIILPKDDFWFVPLPHQDTVMPHFVFFKFRKEGAHMQENNFGIARRGDAMFDMTATVSDIIVEQIKEQYAKD